VAATVEIASHAEAELPLQFALAEPWPRSSAACDLQDPFGGSELGRHRRQAREGVEGEALGGAGAEHGPERRSQNSQSATAIVNRALKPPPPRHLLWLGRGRAAP
jgi:hypothetical protein